MRAGRERWSCAFSIYSSRKGSVDFGFPLVGIVRHGFTDNQAVDKTTALADKNQSYQWLRPLLRRNDGRLFITPGQYYIW